MATLGELSAHELTQKGRRLLVPQAKEVLIYLGIRFKGQTCQLKGEMARMIFQSASTGKIQGKNFVKSNPDFRKLIN